MSLLLSGMQASPAQRKLMCTTSNYQQEAHYVTVEHQLSPGVHASPAQLARLCRSGRRARLYGCCWNRGSPLESPHWMPPCCRCCRQPWLSLHHPMEPLMTHRSPPWGQERGRMLLGRGPWGSVLLHPAPQNAFSRCCTLGHWCIRTSAMRVGAAAS